MRQQDWRRRPTAAPRRSQRRLAVAGTLLLLLVVVLSLPVALRLGRAGAASSSTHRSNLVFVLTDDLASNLATARFMPNLARLERQGAVFTNYFVATSLCCPSRATIFTGRFPHDTGVWANRGPGGGVGAFVNHHNERSTVATDLHDAGYVTAMMGKYLNRYHVSQPPAPGWSEWDVADWGYPEFNYDLNENGRIVHYGGPNAAGKDNYLTDVLAGLADRFVTRTVLLHPTRPFFLEVATFAPHAPYTPAPRYAGLYPGLAYPRTPAFGVANSAAPAWLRDVPPLDAKARAQLTTDFRRRAQSVRSVDDLIGRLVATLRATGQLSNTYFVFSSDNGLHMGEHDLRPGKLTAFDTDIRVPLVVVGPRVAARTVPAFAENVDLRSTFDALAGTRPSGPVDGRSLAPLLVAARGAPAVPAGWRQGVLVEQRGPVRDHADEPDTPGEFAGNPPSYEALRLAHALYVEDATGEREYYDLTTDPYELHNVYASVTPARRQALHAELVALEGCHDRPACSQVTVPAP